MKVWKAEVLDETADLPDGTIIEVSDKGMKVAAGGRTLLIKTIQMPGKSPWKYLTILRGEQNMTGELLG